MKFKFILPLATIVMGLGLGNLLAGSSSDSKGSIPFYEMGKKPLKSKARVKKIPGYYNALISCFGNDLWTTSMNGGLVTFPNAMSRAGFAPPVANTYFQVPQTGTYIVTVNISTVSFTSAVGNRDGYLEIQIDGLNSLGTNCLIEQVQKISGDTTASPISVTRLLTLNKGQSISIYMATSDASLFQIPLTTAPFTGYSNRAISIVRVN